MKEFLKSMQNLLTNQNKITQANFEDNLKNVKFISPVTTLDKSENLAANNINFLNIVDANDDTFFLAFTDNEKFKRFKKDNNFIGLRVDISDFKYMLKLNDNVKGFIINIGDEALFIPKETLN